jgi:D-aspartate ligase
MGEGKQQGRGAPACVLGDIDLVRALGLGGTRSAIVTRPGWPAKWSRYTAERIEWADSWSDQETLLDRLLEFAARQPEPPPLFFQDDSDLLFVSRNREALAGHLRFTVADADTVEQCVDKTLFVELGQRLGLPVPRSIALQPAAAPELPDLEVEPPFVVKPVTRRDEWWAPLAGRAKAIVVASAEEFARLWPRFVEAGVDLVAQELVPGGEDRIESYHVYVDDGGDTAAEFTGRKVRTLPREFGHTTACVITDEDDVRGLGRECTRALALRGVAKLDFKRDPAGALHLLEVNPRFNLWHLPGAVAGVNIPAVVYADLTGTERPPVGPVRPGTSWSVPWEDYYAAREDGVPFARWVGWQARCDAWHTFAFTDPLPAVGAVLLRVRARLPGG